MRTVFLNRYKEDKVQTLGEMVYDGQVIAKTLELPYKANQFRVSCIPLGCYTVVRRRSAKFGNHFHILDVPNRDYILIHNANYYWNLLGCIGVGKDHKDINRDGYLDITDSRKTMTKLLAILPQTFYLVIQ